MRVEGSGRNLLERETPRRSVRVLPSPAGHRRSGHPQDDRDRDRSLHGRMNIHHNKNYIHRKSLSIQNKQAVGILVLEESNQVLRRDVVAGTVLVNKWKLYDLRAFVVFSGCEPVRPVV